MATPDEERRTAVVVLTSNRGLCGGYNANLMRTALAHLDELTERSVVPEIHMVGKKGSSYFRFLGRDMATTHSDFSDQPRFDEVEPMVNSLMERFIAGEIDAVDVAYNKFISTARQRPVLERLLPLSGEVAADGEEGSHGEFEFSPDPQSLLNELLPATVRVRLFQAFSDAAVSEQVARMVAMKAATDAAEDMIKRLTMQYNRARQTQITMELLDIVGGANAIA